MYFKANIYWFRLISLRRMIFFYFKINQTIFWNALFICLFIHLYFEICIIYYVIYKSLFIHLLTNLYIYLFTGNHSSIYALTCLHQNLFYDWLKLIILNNEHFIHEDIKKFIYSDQAIWYSLSIMINYIIPGNSWWI